jgi:Uma2 family endonuclease
MTAMTVMPRGAAEWTVDDLDLLPDDGLQYELLDGLLLVSPSPSNRHQRAGGKLFILLSQACPPDMDVLFALDWRPDRLTSLQPDVLVVGDTDLDTVVGETMILAVEILSPSTRRKDPFLKRSKYQDAGVPSYWIIDPAAPVDHRAGARRRAVHDGGRGLRRRGCHAREAFPRHHCPRLPDQAAAGLIRAWSSARRR